MTENRHYDAAQRLLRKHLTDGHEPYHALLSGTAKLLAEYEQEVLKAEADGELREWALRGRT